MYGLDWCMAWAGALTRREDSSDWVTTYGILRQGYQRTVSIGKLWIAQFRASYSVPRILFQVPNIAGCADITDQLQTTDLQVAEAVLSVP